MADNPTEKPNKKHIVGDMNKKGVEPRTIVVEPLSFWEIINFPNTLFESVFRNLPKNFSDDQVSSTRLLSAIKPHIGKCFCEIYGITEAELKATKPVTGMAMLNDFIRLNHDENFQAEAEELMMWAKNAQPIITKLFKPWFKTVTEYLISKGTPSDKLKDT